MKYVNEASCCMLECYFVRMLFVSHVIRLLNTKVRFGRLCLPHANIVGQSEGSGSILIFDQFKGRILSNLVHMPKYGHVLVFGPLLSHFLSNLDGILDMCSGNH